MSTWGNDIMLLIWEEETGKAKVPYSKFNFGGLHTLVFQIPCEDRCLGISESKAFWGSKHHPHKVFGGFWKTRDIHP